MPSPLSVQSTACPFHFTTLNDGTLKPDEAVILKAVTFVPVIYLLYFYLEYQQHRIRDHLGCHMITYHETD